MISKQIYEFPGNKIVKQTHKCHTTCQLRCSPVHSLLCCHAIQWKTKDDEGKASSQVKNTLQEVSISKSTIPRRPQENTYRRFTARCKSLISLKNRKTRLNFAERKTSRKASTVLEQHSLDRLTSTRKTARKKYREGMEQLWQPYSVICKTWWREFDGLGMHGWQWHWVTSVY